MTTLRPKTNSTHNEPTLFQRDNNARTDPNKHKSPRYVKDHPGSPAWNLSAIYQDRCPCLRHYNYNRYACGQIKTIYKCSLVFLYVCFIVLIMSVMKLQFHHAMKRVRRNMDFVMYDDSMVACFCPSINYINVYHDYVVTLLTCIYVIMHNN